MLSSVALHAGELLAAVLAGGGVLVAVAFAGTLWLRRRIRRRLEGLGLVLAGRARGAVAAAAGAGGRGGSAAEHGGARARRDGAPTGELDALCRQARRAAGSLDRSLAVQRLATAADGGAGSVSAQVTELVSAAGRIQAAAAAALRSSARLTASGLAHHVHREAMAPAAGMASAAPAAAPAALPEEPA